MSYLVLARKYRPQTFSEVVGQEHVTRTLANAFASSRVHHAFLFCGPRGCGKTTLARIVGKALNCEKGPTSEPCGVCSACTSITNSSAVDYLEMDGASNRGIDAIRELTEAVRYQPAALRKKVYVIDEVHMLTAEAFNALLKTLEEPPPHVTFVLATTEPHKLPNTILSRCQRYDFKLVPASRLAQHLAGIFTKESLQIESGAVSLLVRESGGSVRDALSLCDQIISYVGAATITEANVAEVLGVADRSLTRSLVRALAAGDAGAALGAVESAIERGVDEVQLARAIVRYLRDLAVLQVAPDRPELVDASDEERADLVAEAGQLAHSRVSQMFERMLRCCDELGKTLQPRLVLDCALIDVATIEPLIPLGDLIERLGELEAKVAGRGGVRAASGPTSGGAPSKSGLRMTAPGHPAGASRAPAGTSPPAPRESSPQGRGEASPQGRGESSSSPAREASPARGDGQAPGDGRDATQTRGDTGRGEPSPHRSTARGVGPAGPQAERGHPNAPGADDVPPSGRTESSPVATPVATSQASLPMDGTKSGPVSMQPSGPVPKPDSTASGSGPSTSLPASSAEALAAWNRVLALLEERRRFSLLGPFQHARVLKWTADEVALGFPVDVHSMGEMANDRANLDELGAIVRELFAASMSATVRVSVRLLDDAESSRAGARSILETTREKTTAERGKRESEAREHPITKHVLQTFGAQIKEIKTDV